MKKYLLTLDYELYGNGSGHVFQHIIVPTTQLLSIAKTNQLHYTFFVEMVEFLQLRKLWNTGETMGYASNPVEAMEKQLQKAYMEGHDVQLHIHPQWMNAKFNDGRWHVDKSEWRLGGYRAEKPSELYEMVSTCKSALEEIIRKVDPHYECIAIRAGGYNAMPSEQIVEVMNRLNLKIDSSVVPGAIEKGDLSMYDYSVSPQNLGFWKSDKRLEVPSEDSGQLIELPIFALPIRRFLKYSDLERVGALLRNRKAAIETFEAKSGGRKKSLLQKLRWFFQIEFQTWDFCLFSKSMHATFIKQATRQNGRNIFTLVGHPKSLTSNKGFAGLLDLVQRDAKFLTISDFFKALNKNEF